MTLSASTPWPSIRLRFARYWVSNWVFSPSARQAVTAHVDDYLPLPFRNFRYSQMPFKKKMADVQRVLFHPRQPIFFLAVRTFFFLFHEFDGKILPKFCPVHKVLLF